MENVTGTMPVREVGLVGLPGAQGSGGMGGIRQLVLSRHPGRLHGKAAAMHRERSPSIMGSPAVLAKHGVAGSGVVVVPGIPGRRYGHLKGGRSCLRDESSGN